MSSARGWRWLEAYPGCRALGEVPRGTFAWDGPGALGVTPGLVSPAEGAGGWIGTVVADEGVSSPASIARMPISANAIGRIRFCRRAA